jgi:putative glutamine amidotransferase
MFNKTPLFIGTNFNVGANVDPNKEELQTRLSYPKAIEMAGGFALPLVPRNSNKYVSQLFDHLPLSGLLLIGGFDINPSRYGQLPQAGMQLMDPRREEFDFLLAEEAHRRHVPTLGVCAGAEQMAIVLGAKLMDVQPSSVTHRIDLEHDSKHYVDLTPGVILAPAYGCERIEVVSNHHQAVDPDNIGSALVIGAADDDIVEAIADPNEEFFVGVQWHPERALEDSKPLFEAFGDACRRYAERRIPFDLFSMFSWIGH